MGHYRLTERVLGHGSFSQVLLAYAAPQRPVAAKVIPRGEISGTPQLMQSPSWRGSSRRWRSCAR